MTQQQKDRLAPEAAGIARRLDELTMDGLRASGSKKWSTPPGVIGATVAEMDFGVPSQVTAALQSLLDGGVLGYPPAAGQLAMRESCARWQHDAYGWDVPGEWVRPLPDTLTGLHACIQHFTSPGSRVILLTPAHAPFLTVPPQLGRPVTQVPLVPRRNGTWDLDLDNIDTALGDEGDLLVLCNPHNPIGKVYTVAELAAICDLVEAHHARVLSDEIHAPLVYAGHRHVPYASISQAAARHTITVTSASKGWNLSGLKCAQLILSNPSDAERWQQIGFLPEHGSGMAGSIATTAAYTAGRGWLSGVLAYLDDARSLMSDLVATHLPGARYTPPDGTYLAWLDCNDLGLGDDAAGFFLHHAGVAVNDGATNGYAGQGYIRINMATPHHVLATAVERMGHALRSNQQPRPAAPEPRGQ